MTIRVLPGGAVLDTDDGALPRWAASNATAAVRRIAGQVAADAQRTAPYRTGRLRDSIHLTYSGTTTNVDADAPYAVYVEFGTRYMRARPFMRPAANKFRR